MKVLGDCFEELGLQYVIWQYATVQILKKKTKKKQKRKADEKAHISTSTKSSSTAAG